MFTALPQRRRQSFPSHGQPHRAVAVATAAATAATVAAAAGVYCVLCL